MLVTSRWVRERLKFALFILDSILLALAQIWDAPRQFHGVGEEGVWVVTRLTDSLYSCCLNINYSSAILIDGTPNHLFYQRCFNMWTPICRDLNLLCSSQISQHASNAESAMNTDILSTAMTPAWLMQQCTGLVYMAERSNVPCDFKKNPRKLSEND